MIEHTDVRRSRGRPKTGRMDQLSLRLPQTLLDEVDRYMHMAGCHSRAEAIRALVERALGRSETDKSGLHQPERADAIVR